MSFFDDASLVFLPSGGAGKDGKAYSMKPTDGSGDFTFSRGSNLTATRVDSNGLIEKGRENLLLKSNLFDNGGVSPTAWATSNASVTSGQSGYDGSTDAWLLQANSDGGGRRLQQSITQGGVSTLSIYAKAGTTDWLRIEFVGASSYVYFDLTNGVLGSETNAIGKIESIGNGWYRCSAVNTSGSTPSTMRYILASANNNVNVVTGDNIYIQNAQLEIGLVATEPILSGATTGKAGILEDSPRFDYSGGASCPSLLLEPSRTNLISQSEYFDDSLYKKARLTTISNATTSPEGVANAYKILTDNGQNTGYIYVNYAVTSGTTYTASFFIKEAGRQYTQFYSKITGAFKNAVINLSTGDITNSNFATLPKAESFGDGWWRVSFTQTAGVGGDLPIYIEAGTTSTGGVLVGNGTDGVYLYGAQLEEGSYPTSYIPNHSGGSVTRELDEINELTLSDDIRGDCTIFIDTREFLATNQFIQFKATDGTLTYAFYSYSNHYDVYNNSAFIVDSSADANGKIALVQSGSSVKIFVNGQDKTKSGATANTIGIAKIIVSQSGAQNNMVALKQMLLFPSALSDAECITLTS